MPASVIRAWHERDHWLCSFKVRTNIHSVSGAHFRHQRCSGELRLSSALKAFFDQKAAEKATALQLVDAFVTTYSRFRSQFGQDAPVPATFRAHSIEDFNKKLGSDSAFMLRWVGRQGRQIAIAASRRRDGQDN